MAYILYAIIISIAKMSISPDFKTMFDLVIGELKINININEKRLWALIMLELKQHFIKKRKLTGNVYRYRYIHHLHNKHAIKKEGGTKLKDPELNTTYFTNYNKEKGITIKIRQRIKTLDYKASIIPNYSPINLKRWNKITKKSTNKGCVAVSAWSHHYETGGNRSGWTLDGFKAPDLEYFVIKNGFKKEKGKKYQYGDYAEWLLHTLV